MLRVRRRGRRRLLPDARGADGPDDRGRRHRVPYAALPAATDAGVPVFAVVDRCDLLSLGAAGALSRNAPGGKTRNRRRHRTN